MTRPVCARRLLAGRRRSVSMTTAPWIVTTDRPCAIVCLRCGSRLELADASACRPYEERFVDEHAVCEPPPAAVEVRRAGGRPLPGFDAP